MGGAQFVGDAAGATRVSGIVSWARGLAGRVLREARLHARIARARAGGDRIAVLPWGDRTAGSSLLRAWLIAEELEKLGWRTLTLPPRLSGAQRLRLLRRFHPDILLVQGARHALNDPKRLGSFPYVFDLDDADFEDPTLVDRLTRLCAGARGVIGGSRHVADWMRRHNADSIVIWTGAPHVAGAQVDQAARGPLVAWAQADPLGYPLEFAFVKDVMLRLAPRVPGLGLRLYGWTDPNDRAPVAELERAGIAVDLKPRMGYDAFVASLREAALGLSPICAESGFSRGKSFGKILAYLDARVPVICSDEADHALFFDAESGVVSNDREIWAQEAERLLRDPDARTRMAEAGSRRMEERLSTRAAAARLDAFLRKPRIMR